MTATVWRPAGPNVSPSARRPVPMSTTPPVNTRLAAARAETNGSAQRATMRSRAERVFVTPPNKINFSPRQNRDDNAFDKSIEALATANAPRSLLKHLPAQSPRRVVVTPGSAVKTPGSVTKSPHSILTPSRAQRVPTSSSSNSKMTPQRRTSSSTAQRRLFGTPTGTPTPTRRAKPAATPPPPPPPLEEEEEEQEEPPPPPPDDDYEDELHGLSIYDVATTSEEEGSEIGEDDLWVPPPPPEDEGVLSYKSPMRSVSPPVLATPPTRIFRSKDPCSSSRHRASAEDAILRRARLSRQEQEQSAAESNSSVSIPSLLELNSSSDSSDEKKKENKLNKMLRARNPMADTLIQGGSPPRHRFTSDVSAAKDLVQLRWPVAARPLHAKNVNFEDNNQPH